VALPGSFSPACVRVLVFQVKLVDNFFIVKLQISCDVGHKSNVIKGNFTEVVSFDYL